MSRRRQSERKKPRQESPSQDKLAKQPGRKLVRLFVRDARYYPEEKSIVIVGEEVETRRTVTQQGLVKDFKEAYRLPVAEDDHEAWRFFASQLAKRKDPLALVFLNCRTDQDAI